MSHLRKECCCSWCEPHHEVGNRREHEGEHKEERQPHERIGNDVGGGAVGAARRLSDVDLALLDEDGESEEGGEDEGGDGEDEEGGAVADALGVVAGPPEGGAENESSNELEGGELKCWEERNMNMRLTGSTYCVPF